MHSPGAFFLCRPKLLRNSLLTNPLRRNSTACVYAKYASYAHFFSPFSPFSPFPSPAAPSQPAAPPSRHERAPPACSLDAQVDRFIPIYWQEYHKYLGHINNRIAIARRAECSRKSQRASTSLPGRTLDGLSTSRSIRSRFAEPLVLRFKS